MASVNKVILVGYLGKDPEVHNTPSYKFVTISVATTDRWRDTRTGENRESTEWHHVTFNGRLAEIAEQYLRKGVQVYIEGSVHTRKWQDKQTKQERYRTEIRAESLQMLGNRTQGSSAPASDEGYGDYQAPSPSPAPAGHAGAPGTYGRHKG